MVIAVEGRDVVLLRTPPGRKVRVVPVRVVPAGSSDDHRVDHDAGDASHAKVDLLPVPGLHRAVIVLDPPGELGVTGTVSRV
jgi:hypothetical protein